MCGIVGMASGALNIKSENMFEEMLCVDVIRGKDSTGVAIIKKDGWEIVKRAGTPDYILDSEEWKNKLKGLNRAFIGHNRAATVGKINRSNAHPFEFNNVVGVHNGTLHNKFDIDKGSNFGTDSEAIYYLINTIGIEQTIPKLKGAWALAYYDDIDESICLIRNDQRSLFVAFNKELSHLFFASEAWMISALAARNGFTLAEYPKILKENLLHKFIIPETGIDKFKEPITKELLGIPNVIVTFQGSVFRGNTYSSDNNSSDDLLGDKKSKKAEGGKHEEYLEMVGKTVNIRGSSLSRVEGNADRPWMLTSFIAGEPEKFITLFKTFEEGNKYVGKEFSAKVEFCTIRNDEFSGYRTKIVDQVVKRDHKQLPITKEAFEKRYTEGCAWCNIDVPFETDWKAYNHNQLVCEDCAKDPSVGQYLPNFLQTGSC